MNNMLMDTPPGDWFTRPEGMKKVGPAETLKEREFWCPECTARCTESPTRDVSYGHLKSCSEKIEKNNAWPREWDHPVREWGSSQVAD